MPADIHNAFAVIRSCEIFGVAKIHIIAPEKIVSGMRPISKGAMDWVEIVFYKNTEDFLAEINRQNIRLAGQSLKVGKASTVFRSLTVVFVTGK